MKSADQKPAAQLTPDELEQLKWLLGAVLTLVSVATVFYLDIPAWLLLGLTSVSVTLVLVSPRLPGQVPRWAHRLVFPVIVAVFTSDLWFSGELLPSMVRLDILLLLYRGITYRQKRDDLQVIVLGLFLVVVAGVLTVSLAFAVHILAFTACALALLLVITLAEAATGSASGAVPLGTTPAWAKSVSWPRLLDRVRQVTDWRVVTMGGTLFVGLVALSALLFIAIPRFQLENGLFLERFISKKARTGFNDTIRFGDVTEIQQDNGVALSVDVSDRHQIPETPYWRMLVLDDYKDGTFRLSASLRRSQLSTEQYGAVVRGTRRGQAADGTWTFYLESGISRFLPLLGPFEQLQFRERQRFRSARGLELVEVREEPVTMIAYRVEGMRSSPTLLDATFGAQFAARGGNPLAAGAFMLSVPLEETDRLALARINVEINGGRALPAADYMQKASDWLAVQHAYSLQPKTPAGAGDPLVRWLDSKEAGHCELFAGSFVVLARAAGFPARVVTGFRGGSWNGYSNNFTLRNSDAHAWCEIFDQASQSWLRVDPTPGQAVPGQNDVKGEAAMARRNDRSWKARLESLRVFWYRQIVSFDQQSQMDTINAVKAATEDSGRRIREWIDRTGAEWRRWVAAPWTRGRSASIGSAVVLAVLVGWGLWRCAPTFLLWRWGNRSAKGDVVRREAGRWLLRLSERTALDAEHERVLQRELQRLRFGARETWPEPLEVFRRARKLRKSVSCR